MEMRISTGILIVGLLVAGVARAQEPEMGPTTKAQGPTREAQAATVLDAPQALAPSYPELRYQAFQRDFQRDFGLPDPLASSADGLLGLSARLEQRWGDTTVYRWIERGLAAYGWFRASTSMEKRGFDIRMDTDDVAQGKLGVQMTRPLGSATSE